MARVREETQRRSPREGVLRGLAVTGAVITSAGHRPRRHLLDAGGAAARLPHRARLRRRLRRPPRHLPRPLDPRPGDRRSISAAGPGGRPPCRSGPRAESDPRTGALTMGAARPRLRAAGRRRQRRDRARPRRLRVTLGEVARPRPLRHLGLARRRGDREALRQDRRRRREAGPGDDEPERPRGLRPRRRGDRRGRRSEGGDARRARRDLPGCRPRHHDLVAGDRRARQAGRRRRPLLRPPRLQPGAADGADRALPAGRRCRARSANVPAPSAGRSASTSSRFPTRPASSSTASCSRTCSTPSGCSTSSDLEPIEVDACMAKGANQPMGPLQLLDFVGIDVSIAIGEKLHACQRQRRPRAARSACSTSPPPAGSAARAVRAFSSTEFMPSCRGNGGAVLSTSGHEADFVLGRPHRRPGAERRRRIAERRPACEELQLPRELAGRHPRLHPYP